jgi:hypothetical protein
MPKSGDREVAESWSNLRGAGKAGNYPAAMNLPAVLSLCGAIVVLLGCDVRWFAVVGLR